MQRPMKQFTHLLPLLDVQVYGTTNQLPLKLRGPLVAKNITIDGSDSSQFLSGLLFAYCYAASDSEKVIEVENLSSRPYVDMTIDVLRKFGNGVSHENYHTFRIDPSGTIKPDDLEITIDGDWSSAAFWLVAGAIAGDVEIAGLVNNSLLADQAISGLLHSIGARIEWLDGKLKVSKSRMKAFEFDATDCPDLFPVLAILAALCTGESYIKGVHRLFHKESNRAESISEMLENFNVPYSIEDDSFCISGVNTLQGTIIDSHKDHRIVMAAAIGALRANGPVDIEGVEAVNKSYPGFFKDLENVRSARW